ncbi:MAG TPA: hypothetical protein VJO12_16140 [Stellaceae bacterium]|nr:hypothetical protein [Stellaceae bacterium]
MSCWVSGAASAQELDFAAIPPLTDKDSIAAAKLSPTEIKEILDQVEQTSFDTPDSWQTELRDRRRRWRRRARHGNAVWRHW